MAEEWFTYQELGERLGVSPEAARQKAIRGHWPRRTANDGKTQVRVDVEDVRASTPVRKPKDEHPDDDRSPPVEHPSDTQTFEALEAHIATLKEMVAKAEQVALLERDRATGEQLRADKERERADAERDRANDLFRQLEQVREDRATKQASLEHALSELRHTVEAMKRPWWKRLAS